MPGSTGFPGSRTSLNDKAGDPLECFFLVDHVVHGRSLFQQLIAVEIESRPLLLANFYSAFERKNIA
ncbi:hypothetical protein [Streptosporangium subroseum]|uniref:hypothetical protein n=1 Tax=Streptosporangium subroseum TaxID=106412 RepID=UPI0030919787|nr:hypothetical protein OHB15_27615 [Streptosporangium subroseum]